jgi:hypothetical protein
LPGWKKEKWRKLAAAIWLVPPEKPPRTKDEDEQDWDRLCFLGPSGRPSVVMKGSPEKEVTSRSVICRDEELSKAVAAAMKK